MPTPLRKVPKPTRDQGLERIDFGDDEEQGNEEVTIQIQELVRAEVLVANTAMWVKIAELEKRIADSCEARPNCNTSEAGQGAAHVEVCRSFHSKDGNEELQEFSEVWEFHGSCWDAVVFAFIGDMLHPVESAWIILLAFLNALVQSCFIVIVSMSLAQTSLDDDTLTGYHLWRTNIAQYSQYFDPLTQQSLASRVCHGDRSLFLSEHQSHQVSSIRSYLYDNFPFNGPLLCELALFAWILTVTGEMQQVVGMVRSFRCVPRGITNVILLRDHHLMLRSVSRPRFVFVCHLAIGRAIVALILLAVGSKYLVVTISIEAIILNATALAFVFQIDELLYSALAPHNTRRIIASLKPLPIGESISWFGLDASVCVTLVLITGFFVGVFLLLMHPEFARMKRARQELCGGFRDFIYSFPKSGTVVWADTVPVVSKEQTLQALQKTIRYKILRKVIGTDDIASPNVAMHKLRSTMGGGWNVVYMEQWSLKAIGEQFNGPCEDILSLNRTVDTITFFARSALRDITANQSIALCKSVPPYCSRYSADGTFARLYCPATCGCGEATSYQVAVDHSDGCPSTCTQRSRWRNSKNTAPCVDRPLYAPSGRFDSMWRALLRSWRTYVSGWSETYSRRYLQYADEVEDNGCQGVANILIQFGKSLCIDPWIKPLSIFCPQTCDCNSTRAPYCPGTCASFQKV